VNDRLMRLGCDGCGIVRTFPPNQEPTRCLCGALMLPVLPPRGRGPSERRLSDITTALDRVRSSALESAYRNESKPHWREESRETLALYLGEECGELMQALRRGTLDDVLREAGDLVWAVAMLVDAHQSKA
jgi:NTP pyrophosphatase (non-canonical NTP hydrolase)